MSPCAVAAARPEARPRPDAEYPPGGDWRASPASRAEILAALRAYRGAIVLVTHDEGAVEALAPERVVLLPDGVEDAWSDDLTELVALA